MNRTDWGYLVESYLSEGASFSHPPPYIKVAPSGCFAIAYTKFPYSHHPAKVCLILVSPHSRSLAAESGIRFVHASSCRIMCSLALLFTHTSQPFRAVDRYSDISFPKRQYASIACFSPSGALLFFRSYNLLFPEKGWWPYLYGFVLPAESVFLFFRCSLFYSTVTFF